MQKIQEFTELRGIGAVVIAGFVHFWILVYPNFDINNIPFPRLHVLYQYGDIVVEMFFMISGFLMAMHHESVFETGFVAGGVLREVEKRFRKLYPVYISGCLLGGLMIIIYRILYREDYIHSVDLKGAVLYSLMIFHGWGEEVAEYNPTLWCVPVELLCYVFFFVIVFFCVRKKISPIPFYIMLVFIGRIGRVYMLDLPFLHNGTSCRGYQSFFLGCLLLHIYNYAMSKGYKKKTMYLSGIMIFVFFMTCLFYPSRLGDLRFDLEFILVPSIIIFALTSNTFAKILCFQPLQIMGSYSYEVYAIHYPVALLFVTINRSVNAQIDFTLWYWWLLYISVVVLSAFALKRLLYVFKIKVDYEK